MNRLVIRGLLQKCLLVCTTITHGQNVSGKWLMLTACENTHCIINSHLWRNSSLSVKWLEGCFAYEVTAPWWRVDPILRVSRAVQEVGVRACVHGGLDWVSWHNRRANARNKSVSLTRCLSSSDIPRCPHQLWTNKDVWEKNRSDHSRCQGEMHLVSEEIRQVWEVHQNWLLTSVSFISAARHDNQTVCVSL